MSLKTCGLSFLGQNHEFENLTTKFGKFFEINASDY